MKQWEINFRVIFAPDKKRRAKHLLDELFFNPLLNFNHMPAAKKRFKNGTSQQTFGTSYFDRALEGLHYTFNVFVTSKNETTNSPIHESKVLQNFFSSL